MSVSSAALWGDASPAAARALTAKRWPSDAVVALMLASGGDERIRPDPVTGRNRYGTAAKPCADEIFFSSSTATSVSRRGFDAAAASFAALRQGADITVLFEDIRARLLALFGIPGSEAVLAGSGTEAEFITLALARSLMPGPLATLVVAPDETGSGVLWASAGRHFLGSSAFAPNVPQGEPLEGVETAAIASTSVAIRHPSGAMRGADEIDAEICDRTMTALAQGRSVLVHLLETSKTGQSGLSLPMARHLASAGAGRVLVVADCCQLRAGADAVRDFLALDFPVILTGSKFMGGPAFAGAVLVPPALRARLATLVLPQGLADYSARLDWPARCQAHVGQTLAADANPGLGLRWVAALAEMERYASIAAPMRDAILERFARETVGRAAAVPGLRHLAEPRPFSPLPASIHCFSMHRPSGSALTPAKTAAIHVALRTAAAAEGPLARRIHLGQPVALGATSFGALSALRVCAGAPMVSAVAERMDSGDDLETAFEPVAGDLAVLFAKWTRILASYG